MELGLGISLGRAGGRWAGLLEYTYQRIDRKVSGQDVPIATAVARVGLGGRF